MAKITRMVVSGLLGKDGERQFRFEDDINIIYGQNGKGKTAILTMIACAFSNLTDDLKKIEFGSCRIGIRAPEYGRSITKTIERTISYASPLNDMEFLSRFQDDDQLDFEIDDLVDEAKFKWENIDAKGSSFALDATFLKVDRIHRFSSDSSADESDSFSQQIKYLWTSYNSKLLSQIRQSQDDMIVDLLLENDQVNSPEPSNIREMYAIVSSFSKRRRKDYMPEFELSIEEFRNRYNTRNDFKRIVNSIVGTEYKQEKIDEPRNILLNILKDLFSDDIAIRLFRNNIHFYSSKGRRIYLDRLSSGEKHILYILVSVANAGSGLVLIDEPELSMHINWQRKLLGAVASINPNAQVIMATHSPEIVSSNDRANFIRI